MQMACDVLEHHLKMFRELNRKNKLPIEVTEEHIKIINRFMKEKKTKTMTKAEAFEWLKGKKIKCICAVAYEDAQANKVERFLKAVGCKYHFANHISWRDWYWPLYGFIVDKKGEIYVAFEDQMDFFEQNFNEPISADDILSIEIVEDEFSYDKVVELAKPLMAYLNEVGCRDGIRVSQLGIVHEPMSTLIFDNGIGRIE
jgi:hypothetical protein